MISAYSMVGSRVVSILDVREGRVASDAAFICPQCHTHMHPALGQVRRPHFRHRDLSRAQSQGCSPEGILHSTAKVVIAERLAAAMTAGGPYPLHMSEAIACPHRRKILGGNCRHRRTQRSMDLAQFSRVGVEASRGPFRYDLLLEGGGREPLAIEILVSSPATQAKRAANVSMIEVVISDEADVEKLAAGINDRALRINGVAMETHFGPPATNCAHADCASPCLSFSVSSAGRVQLEEQLPFEACRARAGRAYHVAIDSPQAFALSRFEALDRLTRQAYYVDRAAVRSCLVCRHHAIADFSADGEGPVICHQDGRRGSVNRGADCLYFTPFATIDEVRQHRLDARAGGVIEE